MPPSRPATAGGCSRRPSLVAHGRGELDDHLHDRAGAEAEQERGEAGVEGRRADPRAEHRGRAGDQPEHGQPRERRRLAWRPARRSPGPRSCCAARSPRPGRLPERARRSRTPTRWRRPRRGCAARSRPRRAARDGGRSAPLLPPALEPLRRRRVSARNATAAPTKHERGAAERLRALAGELEALERRVDREEREQPDRQRHHDAQRAGRDAAHPRQPQHPERDRDHADVDAEQRHQPEEARRRSRASPTAAAISWAIVPPVEVTSTTS